MALYIGRDWHKSTKEHLFIRKKHPQVLADTFDEEYNAPALGNKPNIGGWENAFALISCCFVRGSCEALALRYCQRNKGQNQP